MDNNEIERVAALKFLGLLLDKCMSWKYHISYFEYKIFKSIGLIYKEKSFLIKKTRLAWRCITLIFKHTLIMLIWHGKVQIRRSLQNL